MRGGRNAPSLIVGAILLALYLLQAAVGWEWDWLARLQEIELFKRWSGGVLLAYLLHQWWLSLGRSRGWARLAKKSYWLHQWMGVLSPAFFYAHSMRLGYGFLLLLSTVYLGNVVIGLSHRAVNQLELRRLGTPWMILHITASLLVSILALYHVWIVVWYE